VWRGFTQLVALRRLFDALEEARRLAAVPGEAGCAEVF
jgi:hypothetical protein